MVINTRRLQLDYMYRIALLSLALFFSLNTLKAKDISLEIAYSQFLDANSEAYLEVYFSLNGNSVDYILNDDGLFVGGIEVTIKVQQDSMLFGADRFRLLSPAIDDTSNISETFIHQSRLALPLGAYDLILIIEDINEEGEAYQFEQQIEVKFNLDAISSSDVILLEDYKKSNDPGVFSKSGYDLIPLVTSGSAYFPETMEEISFYTEFYNTDKQLGADEPFVLKYYLRDQLRNKELNEYASFARRTANAVTPLLASFNIGNLPSGNYELVIELLNRSGENVYTMKKFFYRKNNNVPMNIATLSDSMMMETFANQLGGLDSIFLFIKYLYPISTDMDHKLQNELLTERNLENMKRYFYGFWARTNPETPRRAWLEYHTQVKIANKYYNTKIRPGYRSDRGRVFLVYGKPSRTDARRMEPSLPPYEIWQYDDIRTPYAVVQNNRVFIFAEFQPSTNDYELFHSTAIGELSSNRWRYDMAMKYSGMNGNIEEDRPGQEFGSRTNNNIILNSTGTDRDNR